MKWNGEKQLSTWNANFSFVQFIQERVFRLLVWCRMCAAANVCANGGLRVPMILCTKQQAEADKNYNKKKLRKKHSLLHFVNVYLKKTRHVRWSLSLNISALILLESIAIQLNAMES